VSGKPTEQRMPQHAHQSVPAPLQPHLGGGSTKTRDDLLSLPRIKDSFFLPRNTAFTYKGKAIDAKQI